MAASEPPSWLEGMDVDDASHEEEHTSAPKRPRCLDQRLEGCVLEDRRGTWTPPLQRTQSISDVCTADLGTSSGQGVGPTPSAAQLVQPSARSALEASRSLFVAGRQPSGGHVEKPSGLPRLAYNTGAGGSCGAVAAGASTAVTSSLPAARRGILSGKVDRDGGQALEAAASQPQSLSLSPEERQFWTEAVAPHDASPAATWNVLLENEIERQLQRERLQPQGALHPPLRNQPVGRQKTRHPSLAALTEELHRLLSQSNALRHALACSALAEAKQQQRAESANAGALDAAADSTAPCPAGAPERPRRHHSGGAAVEPVAEVAVPATWADIPDDLLKRVLTRLHPSSLRLCLVCRSWEQMAGRFVVSLKPERLCEDRLLGSRFPYVHSLDLSNCVNVVHCVRANELRLRSALTDRQLACAAGLLKLQEVSLRGCTSITGEGMHHITRLPRLRKLDLSGCAGLTDEGAAHLALAKSLTWLSLRGCRRLSDRALQVLERVPLLRHLCLAGCVGITDAAMASVLTLCLWGLMRLDLDRCQGLTDAGLAMLGNSGGKFPMLRHLSLSGCQGITNFGLSTLRGMTSLESLDISACSQVDDAGLHHLAVLPRLRLLTLGGTPVLSNLQQATLREIFEGAPSDLFLHVRVFQQQPHLPPPPLPLPPQLPPPVPFPLLMQQQQQQQQGLPSLQAMLQGLHLPMMQQEGGQQQQQPSLAYMLAELVGQPLLNQPQQW